MLFGRKNKRNNEDLIRDIFPNAAVFKPFTRMEKLPGVPQRIWEYFILKHLNNIDFNSNQFEESFDNMMRVARERIPESGSRNATLNQLKNNGFVEIIDAILVDVNPNDLEYLPVSHHLGNANLSISREIVEENQRILYGFVWGRVLYRMNNDKIEIMQFTEIQNTNIRLEEFELARQNFTKDEWINLLVRSVGLNDEWLDEEGRWHVINRLLPLVEPRLHMMEPGPKETGKTTTYTNLDSSVSVVTGLDITMAKLIYDGSRNRPGIIARNTNGVVVFDELQNGHDRRNVSELAGQLKQVMESGRIERLNFQAETDASIVFVGNTQNYGDQIHQLLPSAFREAAFLSRISGMLDGHQMPTLQRGEISLAQGMGLACDYLSEILRKLRIRPTSLEIFSKIKFNDCSNRDEKAVKRIISAYSKLLYPDGNITQEEMNEIVLRAVNLRQPISDAAAIAEGKNLKKIIVDCN